MNNNKTKYIYGIHTISNIINSDASVIKKIYFKKNPLSKNLSNLFQQALDASIHTEEADLDKLTLLCESRKHQGVVCQLDENKLSGFNTAFKQCFLGQQLSFSSNGDNFFTSILMTP